MTTQLLTMDGAEALSPTATQAAFDKRDELALTCATVKTVVNVAQAGHAAAVLKEAKGFSRLIEESRKSCKGPIIEIGKRIDDLGKQLTEFVDVECGRISRLLGAFQAEQARLAQEAAYKAQAEERRIREEAARKIDEAEQHSRSAASADKKIERIEAQAFEAIVTARTSAATMVTPKPSGIATRTVSKFEVTDIHALYAARPELVKMEPNTSIINAVLRNAPRASIPGLRVWEESAAIVR